MVFDESKQIIQVNHREVNKEIAQADHFDYLNPFLLFFSSVESHSTTIDFNALALGTVETTIQDVAFCFNISGYDLIVSNIFDTTSGSNCLGAGDGGLEVFHTLAGC